MTKPLYPWPSKQAELEAVIKSAKGNRSLAWLAHKIGLETASAVRDYFSPSRKRQPPRARIANIAFILGLDYVELAELSGRDPEKVKPHYERFRADSLTTDELIDQAELVIQSANDLSAYVTPQKGSALLDLWIRHLRKREHIERKTKNHLYLIRKKLQKAHRARMKSVLSVCSYDEVDSAIKKDMSELLRLDEHLANPRENAYRLFWQTDGNLVARSFRYAADEATHLVKPSIDLDSIHRSWTHRIRIRGYGYVRDKDNYDDADMDAIEFLETLELPLVRASLNESRARSQSLLGRLKEAKRNLADANEDLVLAEQNGEDRPRLRIEIGITELTLISSTEKPDKDRAVEVAEPTLILAKRHRSERQIEDIREKALKLGVFEKLEYLFNPEDLKKN